MSTSRLLSYAVALVCVLMGCALLFGVLHAATPGALGPVCGSILLLLGINRALVTRWKRRASHRRRLRDGA